MAPATDELGVVVLARTHPSSDRRRRLSDPEPNLKIVVVETGIEAPLESQQPPRWGLTSAGTCVQRSAVPAASTLQAFLLAWYWNTMRAGPACIPVVRAIAYPW